VLPVQLAEEYKVFKDQLVQEEQLAQLDPPVVLGLLAHEVLLVLPVGLVQA
jgi:hypothetical protein